MDDTENIAQANSDEAVTVTETEAAKTEVSEAEVSKEEEAPAKATQEQAEVDYTKIELPEGFTMNEEALKEFMPLAKELGMNQEQAQKALALHSKVMGDYVKVLTESRDNAYTEVMKEVKADKDLGGEKYEQNMGRINATLEKFGGEADIFHAAIAQIAGFDKGKAKAMYATLDRIAKETSVDEVLVGGGANISPEDYADVMFPTTAKRK